MFTVCQKYVKGSEIVVYLVSAELICVDERIGDYAMTRRHYLKCGTQCHAKTVYGTLTQCQALYDNVKDWE
jgi:hypothetical protein